LGTQPDYNTLINASPALQNAQNFGRDALAAQERINLEKIFQTVKRDNLITVRDHYVIDTIAPTLQTVQLKNIDADTPINFDVGPSTYGVFIRNAAAMVLPLQAPFNRGGDWAYLQKAAIDKKPLLVEMTLQPIGADKENFTTFEDQTVKPIIADLIEIKVYDPVQTNNLILSKRDEKAFENLMQDDEMMPAPAQ
jgi:hypothetical protein